MAHFVAGAFGQVQTEGSKRALSDMPGNIVAGHDGIPWMHTLARMETRWGKVCVSPLRQVASFRARAGDHPYESCSRSAVGCSRCMPKTYQDSTGETTVNCHQSLVLQDHLSHLASLVNDQLRTYGDRDAPA